MCLQIPGKVVKITGNKAIVDYDIEKRTAVIADLKPKVGDWVLVVGKFIEEIVPDDAGRESLDKWLEIMKEE
jgi:hydrogenase assembly chaperone HypC/HupF